MWSSTTPTTPGGGFGNFAIGGGASVIGDKRVGSTAGGSRLAHLIPKDSTDVSSPKAVETPNPLNQQSWRSRPRTDTDPFGDDVPTGSAALGGAQDSSPSMPEQVGRIGTLSTPVKGTAGDFGMSNLGLGGDGDGNGGNSPSGTNPYRSPLNDRSEHDDGDRPGAERVAQHEPLPGFSAVSRGFPTSALEGSDRSQTSSVGAKGFPLPGVAGWPGAPGGPSTGTPDRERANFSHAFGNSLFNPMGELQSPGLGNLGSVFGPAGTGAIGTGSIGRGSKMGSLFPAAMQAQMHSHEQESSVGMSEAATDLRQSNPLGAIGRGNFPPPTRDTESPMRSNRGVFEELFPTADMPPRTHAGPFGASEGTVPAGLPGAQSYTPVSAGGLPFTSGQSNADSSAGHMRQMVMPDRMRWVYLDPQSQIQGPFTGLEMNDWYKANFFTPDLRVKKVEDHDFEPLGQLIRRIGNSREPFLVPQIGVPHGPPPQPGPFAPASSGVVPPLSGVFPSFGRTLTAEEQNNLERRKQEEQYMMAQQREFMMRQQAMTKFPLPAQGLQHHSSAHSLQSQPSFGSMTSPVGAQPHQQPMSGLAGTGFFETAIGAPGSGHGAAGASSGNIDPYTQDELSNLTMSERQMLAKIDHMDDSHQAQGSTGEDITGHSGLPDPDQLEEDPEGFHERLRQFNDLRAQHDAEQSGQAVEQADAAHPDATVSNESNDARSKPSAGKAARAAKKKALEEASLSLTQQVQQAQAAAAAAAHQVEEPDMPMPFPPPSSSTPLPAPMAQRVRSNLPEQYSRSQTGTPDASNAAQPPPLAPWAKESSVEAQRGPSLKEIQESEARKARKAAETAQALRRAAMEQEVASLREKEKLAEAAAGLPASSTWAHGSPVSPASPWTKPSAVKGPAPGLPGPAPSSNKKTLAEIQREEELRKQKATSRDSPLTAPAPVANASKSYANLAGKPGQPPIPNAATAAATTQPPAPGWSTVGAGGKVKIPTGPSAASRVVSSPVTKPTVSIPPVKAVSRSAVTGVKSNENLAMDEFNKWVHRELSRGITGVNDSKSYNVPCTLRTSTKLCLVANFQATLDILPLDTGIIADAVYANSKTMDGRHFADEFVRRKKLAEKGVVIDKQPSSAVDPKASASGTGGWSEVAKKGGPAGPSAPTPGKEADQGMQGAGFKVVPSRKKNKK